MSRTHWIILGLVSIGLLAYMMKPFTDVLLFGLFLYYVLRPLYRVINKRIHQRELSAALAISAVIIPLLLIIGYTISIASTQFTSLVKSVDDPVGIYLNTGLSRLSTTLKGLQFSEFKAVLQQSSDLGLFLLQLSTSTLGVIFKILLVFAVAFYTLKYGPTVRAWFLCTITNERERKLAQTLFNDIDDDLHHVFFGNILVSVVTAVLGIIVYVGLDILSPEIKIPYPILLGSLSGVANLIPVVGMKLIWIPLVIYLAFKAYIGGVLMSSIGFLVVSALAIYIIVDWFPDMVLRPFLSGSKRIPMGVLFFTYIFGVAVFGFTGILIGPIIVVTVLNFLRVVLPEIKKK
ncbi:MAG: AI-2E family transporter [Methanobacteriota archaeon]